MADLLKLTEEMDKLLECNICLERLAEPKVLNCTHSYCKSCLDSILEFRPDGSAIINCPLRCNEQTHIDIDKTTNDLKASLQFKNIVTLLVERDVANDNNVDYVRCHEYPKCTKVVSVYCCHCFVKLCHSCKTNHKHDKVQNCGDQFIQVRYKRDKDELLPWCEEHKTYAAYACQEGFICLYCKARRHSSHRNDTIDTLFQQIVSWVRDQETQLPDIENLLKTCKERSEYEVTRIRKSLQDEIKFRKCISIQNHLAKLCEEEEKLLSAFDSSISKHFQSYPLSNPIEYIENKEKFEVFAQKDGICQNVGNVISAEVAMQEIYFTFLEEHIDDTNPLGLLKEMTGNVNLTADTVTVSSAGFECGPTHGILPDIINELKLIQQELEGYVTSETEQDANTSGIEQGKQLVAVINYFNKDTDKSKMLYLCDLIVGGDITSFVLLWEAIPQYLLKLKIQSYNILHVASTMDKPEFVSVILEAGAKFGFDINESVNGATALFAATVNERHSIVQLLVAHGANILMKVGDEYIIDFTKQANHTSTMNFLLDEIRDKKMVDTGKFKDVSLEDFKKQYLAVEYVTGMNTCPICHSDYFDDDIYGEDPNEEFYDDDELHGEEPTYNWGEDHNEDFYDDVYGEDPNKLDWGEDPEDYYDDDYGEEHNGAFYDDGW